MSLGGVIRSRCGKFVAGEMEAHPSPWPCQIRITNLRVFLDVVPLPFTRVGIRDETCLLSLAYDFMSSSPLL